MIKLKSEYGKCHLQMGGKSSEIMSDIIVALDAICEAFEKHGAKAESITVKKIVSAWSEGVFDDRD